MSHTVESQKERDIEFEAVILPLGTKRLHNRQHCDPEGEKESSSQEIKEKEANELKLNVRFLVDIDYADSD